MICGRVSASLVFSRPRRLQMESPIDFEDVHLTVLPEGIYMSFPNFLNMLVFVSRVQNPEKLCTQVRNILFAGIYGRGCETQEETFTQDAARKCENLCAQFREMVFAGIDGRPPKEIFMEYGGTSSAQEGPKWAELNRDILPILLQKAGIVTLLSSAPYVCKAWHETSLDPKCWENLDFSELFKLTIDGPDGIPSIACIKSIVDRSCRRATSLTLPNYFTPDALEYVGNECPQLKSLSLPGPMSYQQSVVISNQISKWGNLETVELVGGCHMKKILPQISLHCKTFTELRAPQSYIGKDEASLIVTFGPKIKNLSLKGSTIERENLVTIMQGCSELEILDVSDCTGFQVDDAEILQLASVIPVFKCEGSRDFEDHRHRLFNGVRGQDPEEGHIDINWDLFFQHFGLA